MAADNFWNNREKAQEVIDEANSLRNKIEPLISAEKSLDDLRVMLELGESEPADAQPKIEQEISHDLEKFLKELDSLEHLIVDAGILERDVSEIDLRSPTHYFFVLRSGEKKDVPRGKET